MGSTTLEELQRSTHPSVTRRDFLRRAALLGGFAATAGFAGYSGLLEPNEVEVTRIEMKIARLAPAFDGFKVAVLSDFHYGPYTGEPEISRAVKTANALQPDVVTLLGDFVSEPLGGMNSDGARKAEPCAEVLANLRSTHGVFSVLGNHDYTTDPRRVADALRRHKLNLLQNASQAIERNGSRLWITGVTDVIFGQPDLNKALAGVPKDDPKLLLAHEPDFADYAVRSGVDVQLSGHSHGGQIRIPGIRPLWLPEMGQKYYLGKYNVGPLQVYTNRGIGAVGVPFRFCSPPEVTLITLRSKA